MVKITIFIFRSSSIPKILMGAKNLVNDLFLEKIGHHRPRKTTELLKKNLSMFETFTLKILQFVLF